LGNWAWATGLGQLGLEGWLCPALLRSFSEVPNEMRRHRVTHTSAATAANPQWAGTFDLRAAIRSPACKC